MYPDMHMCSGLFLGAVVLTVACILHSPARSCAGQSLSEDSLDSDALASETPPQAPSPKSGCDTEVSSQRGPDQGRHVSGAGHTGAAAPRRVDGGGDLRFGPQPDTVLETFKALGSGEQPPLTGEACLLRQQPLSKQSCRAAC